MTDYSGLIARVRSPYALTERDAQEIADALEAQAKEIEELQTEKDNLVEQLCLYKESAMHKDLQEVMRINNVLVASIADLEEENKMLRGALRAYGEK